MNEGYYANFRIGDRLYLRVIHRKLQDFYAEIIYRLVGLPSMCGKIPFSNPSSIMKNDLPSFSVNNYVISEKTDGVRYLFCLVKHEETKLLLMIDRSFGIYIIPGIIFSDDLYEGTIFDGELVRNKENKHIIYLFDILSLRGENLTSKHFKIRYQHLAHTLTQGYRYNDNDPFELRVKKFYSMKDIDMILESIIPQLEHKNDGLIFTQVDSFYKIGMQRTTLKWKKPDQHTVDFLIKEYNGPRVQMDENDKDFYWILELWLLNVEKKEIHANYTPITRDELLNLGFEYIFGIYGLICECKWDAKRGWRPIKIRYDKCEPNSEFVFRRTIANIEENITLGQIKQFYCP